MDAFSLGAEQTQYLDRAAPVTAEPMRVSGVEFSSFTRTHHDVVIGQHQPQPPRQHVQPFVAVVHLGIRFRLACRDGHLECLQPTRLPSQRQYRSPTDASRRTLDAWIGDLRCRHQLVQRHLVGKRDRKQQLQARATLPASSLDRVLFEIPVDSDSAVSVTFLCVRMRLRRAPICEMAASMCGPLTFMVPSLTAIPINGNISC